MREQYALPHFMRDWRGEPLVDPARTFPGHDLSAGELAHGPGVREGSRWVRIGELYGYPGPKIFEVRAVYGGLTIRDENFHTIEHHRSPVFVGRCRVIRTGPGRWDDGEFEISTQELLAQYEPYKTRDERRGEHEPPGGSDGNE